MGRASNRKKQRREEESNPWQTKPPVDPGDERAVRRHLQGLLARLEYQRHNVHSADVALRDTAKEHHDRTNRAIAAIQPDLARDPDDDILGRAHAGHLTERRRTEEVHQDLASRVESFAPKL